ncbi:MAG: UDP-N-acetylmuramoyl-L-alanyl-D-glutamate--2,6-diaminopimelate ligase [Thermodesulfobacteriota bacterium]|nr:UDP-N-acetylmuramoyl-L-alanyl-D-glutamate--2,6-diaminopimelate ligase [Thermodesulfobacteriota bacterium]
MKLRSLLDSLVVKGVAGLEDQVIEDIYYDSRNVKPGGLFVAVPGFQADGHAFINDAVQRGATAIVTEKRWVSPSSVSVVEVENARRALAALSSAFYGEPSRELFVIGITGTNGKTTTAYLVESILSAAGFDVGVIGTINYRFGGQTFVNPVTTPESLDLTRILRQMVDNGVTHAVLEVSSHALDLDRVAFCDFDVGVFTNLSRDHLDYHGDMEVYWQCKRKLFLESLGLGAKQIQAAAVVNWDDSKGRELASEIGVRCLPVGLSAGCQIRAEHPHVTIGGASATVKTPKGAFDFSSPLIGRHNVYNVLAATGVAVAMGLPVDAIKKGIESLQGVPGRLEPVANEAGIYVFVDYAHTPDALENVLTALKELTSGRLIAIFGCGGDRDRDKRPMMGAIAGRLCDLCLLTSDNPRTESPEAILLEILAGMDTVQDRRYEPVELAKGFDRPGYAVEPDRRRAIALGIGASRCGDTVLIAGKGHETYQIMGGRVLAFDDRVEARKILGKLSLATDK